MALVEIFSSAAARANPPRRIVASKARKAAIGGRFGIGVL
jgi:hypothetical protein